MFSQWSRPRSPPSRFPWSRPFSRAWSAPCRCDVTAAAARLFRHGAGGSGVTSGRRLPAAERGRHVHIAGLQHLQPAELGGCGERGGREGPEQPGGAGLGRRDPAPPRERGGRQGREAGRVRGGSPGAGTCPGDPLPSLGIRHLPWGPAAVPGDPSSAPEPPGRAVPRFPGSPCGPKGASCPPLLPPRRREGLEQLRG